MLDPPRRLGRRLGAQEVALGVQKLALPLGEELLLGAQAVAPVGGEALTLGDLGLGLDDLRRPLAKLPGFLGERERALLDRPEGPAKSLVGLLLQRAQLLPVLC